jgi:hypothetical protein
VGLGPSADLMLLLAASSVCCKLVIGRCQPVYPNMRLTVSKLLDQWQFRNPESQSAKQCWHMRDLPSRLWLEQEAVKDQAAAEAKVEHKVDVCVYMYICVVFMCICVCMCVCACIYMCIYVCMCVYV